MASALGFVNSKGGKTILASGNNTGTINVTLPSQGGTLLTSANGIIPGTIQSFAFKNAPNGWLVCDGSVLKRGSYADLFDAIGTTFNTGGEAADEFRIPNMGGQFLRGWVQGQTVDAGRVFGSYQEDTFAQHTHDTTESQHTHVLNAEHPNGVVGWNSGGNSGWAAGTYGSPTRFCNVSEPANANVIVGDSVGGGPETRPKNVAMLFCIFTGLVTQFDVSEGVNETYLIATNNLSDVTNVAQARQNLQLGSAATNDVGVGANDIVQLDGSGKLPAVDGSQLKNIPFGSGKVKAWAFWNASGTVFGQYGLTSITVESPAVYVVNFASPFNDTGYGFSCGCNQIAASQGMVWTTQNLDNPLKSTTQNRIYTLSADNIKRDTSQNYAAWFE